MNRKTSALENLSNKASAAQAKEESEEEEEEEIIISPKNRQSAQSPVNGRDTKKVEVSTQTYVRTDRLRSWARGQLDLQRESWERER